MWVGVMWVGLHGSFCVSNVFNVSVNTNCISEQASRSRVSDWVMIHDVKTNSKPFYVLWCLRLTSHLLNEHDDDDDDDDEYVASMWQKPKFTYKMFGKNAKTLPRLSARPKIRIILFKFVGFWFRHQRTAISNGMLWTYEVTNTDSYFRDKLCSRWNGPITLAAPLAPTVGRRRYSTAVSLTGDADSPFSLSLISQFRVRQNTIPAADTTFLVRRLTLRIWSMLCFNTGWQH